MLRAPLTLFFLSLCLPHQALSARIPDSAAHAGAAQIPDIAWNPAPFKPEFQEPVRYIDYESGRDTNPGTREQPWKHHPWDSNAQGKSASASGIPTYVFKKGITYRGQLNASESGNRHAPIRLTVDPDWGVGNATLTGADILPAEWHACSESEASALPESSRHLTYCSRIPRTTRLHQLWIANGSDTTVYPARFPNWSSERFPDPRTEWLELDNIELEMEIGLSSTAGIKPGDQLTLKHMPGAKLLPKKRQINPQLPVSRVSKDFVAVITNDWPKGGLKKGTTLTNGRVSANITSTSGTHTLIRRLYDSKSLMATELGDLTGATIRVERPSTQQLTTALVLSNDVKRGFLRTRLHLAPRRGPRVSDRYYLEGLPQLLDQPGEFAATSVSGKNILYLRLPDDRDPNTVSIEIPTRLSVLELKNQQHIEVSGLTFRHVRIPPLGTRDALHATLHSAAIQIRGNATHIKVHHCRFEHLESGVVAYPTGRATGEVLDHIVINDNDFEHIDGSAIVLGSGRDRASHVGKGRMIHSTVLRNRIQSTGLLPSSHWGQGSVGHSIDISGSEVVEVAHNLIRNTGGSGINVYMGNTYERSGFPQPFLRGQIHHNKVSNSLLGAQDFGGIESWNGGPMYIFNNISANPVGYRHGRYRRGDQSHLFKRGSYGIGIYLDSQYKAYVFNNIAWGYNNDANSIIYNAAGFNEAMGFMNTVFNNTFMDFAVGIHKGGAPQHNRSSYLGNLLLDMGHSFILQEPGAGIEHETLAYKNNVFHGNPDSFGKLGRKERTLDSLGEWRSFLTDNNVLVADTGIHSDAPVVRDTQARDFRPAANSAAIDSGAKVFVPWALARVVGEWNFYQSATPSRVRDESLNMNETWLRSFMYQYIPRADLECPLSGSSDYTRGELENWVPGVLRFDGQKQYCKIGHSRLTSGFDWNDFRTNETGSFSGKQRDTVDIGKESFLIEAVLATKPNASGYGVLSKQQGNGYSLDVNQDGVLLLSLNIDSAKMQALSRTPVNNGDWHHVIVEVERHRQGRINFYIDGKLDSTTELGAAFADESLSNQGDFLVGKSPAGLFQGKLDFLRLSKATLADAETDIGELYEWEFNGPNLRDFTGGAPTGKSRDAGAVEHNQ